LDVVIGHPCHQINYLVKSLVSFGRIEIFLEREEVGDDLTTLGVLDDGFMDLPDVNGDPVMSPIQSGREGGKRGRNSTYGTFGSLL